MGPARPRAGLRRRPSGLGGEGSSGRSGRDDADPGRHGPRLGPDCIPAPAPGRTARRAGDASVVGRPGRCRRPQGIRIRVEAVRSPGRRRRSVPPRGSGRPRPSTPARFASGSPTSTVPPLPPARRPAGGWSKWARPSCRTCGSARRGLSAEAVERLQKLEERLSDPVPPAETLRALRAIAVLERVGTTDARKLLDELARGASDAPQRQGSPGRPCTGCGPRGRCAERAVAPSPPP